MRVPFRRQNDFRIRRADVVGDVLEAVVDPIWNGLKTPYEPDPRLYTLSAGQRAIYALRWIVAEVNNGGFDQLMFNSTGYLFPEALEAARTLDSAEWIVVLDEAAAIIGEPFPRDRGQRQERLDALSEDEQARLGLLDDRVYALQAKVETNPDRLSSEYIERFPQEFFNDQ